MRQLMLLLLLPAVILPGTSQPQPRTIFISLDMEGISGVVQPAQLGPEGFEYQRAHEWMTGEVNAAIAGIREAGPADIVVCDSHGNGQRVLIDKLPDDVRTVRGFPRPLEMMQGIDDSFAAALFIGYHGSWFQSDHRRGARRLVPGVQRADAHNVRGVFHDMLEITKLLQVLANQAP